MSKDASKNTEPMDEELKDKAPETPETETVPETEAAAPAPEPTAEEKLQAQLSELNDRYLRTLAEYDNYRKRTAKEKEAIYPEAKASTLASMLPVLDNFERAMAAPCSDADFKKGMELIRKAFDELLEKQGVEAFGEVGDPFDPQLHAAVAIPMMNRLGKTVSPKCSRRVTAWETGFSGMPWSRWPTKRVNSLIHIDLYEKDLEE